MGHIHIGFNTKTKILSDVDGFFKDNKEIIKLWGKPIFKVEMHLWPKMKSL